VVHLPKETSNQNNAGIACPDLQWATAPRLNVAAELSDYPRGEVVQVSPAVKTLVTTLALIARLTVRYSSTPAERDTQKVTSPRLSQEVDIKILTGSGIGP
jgi:hypothetical protein